MTTEQSSKAPVHNMRDPITLTRFILQERQAFAPDSTGNFAILLQSIQLACKVISSAAHHSGIANMYGLSGEGKNTSGDEVKKLDVLSNDVMINALSFSDEVYIMGSEENKDPIIVGQKTGGYAVVFDPLDGSSNIDCNLTVGTIFGIYRKDPKSTKAPSLQDLLRPGNELVAAGYAMYGTGTTLVLTTGHGVNGFSLDPTIGEFILTHRNIRIPKKGKMYSINEGNSPNWDKATYEFVNQCKKQGKSGRYVGSMVADIHRTLLYGGIFSYPGDQKNKNGKLRLIYECNPMSFLIEQAGGKSTTGTQRVLDIVPKALHEKRPIFAGSPEEVTLVEELYKKYGNQLAFPPAPKKTEATSVSSNPSSSVVRQHMPMALRSHL